MKTEYIVAIAIVLAGAGFFLYQNMKKEDVAKQQQQQQQAQSSQADQNDPLNTVINIGFGILGKIGNALADSQVKT